MRYFEISTTLVELRSKIFGSFGRFRRCDANLPSLGRRCKFFPIVFQLVDHFLPNLLNLPSLGRSCQFPCLSSSLASWSWRWSPVDVCSSFFRSCLSFLSNFNKKTQCLSLVFSCCSLASWSWRWSSVRSAQLQFGELEFWHYQLQFEVLSSLDVFSQQLRSFFQQFRQMFDFHKYLQLITNIVFHSTESSVEIDSNLQKCFYFRPSSFIGESQTALGA